LILESVSGLCAFSFFYVHHWTAAIGMLT